MDPLSSTVMTSVTRDRGPGIVRGIVYVNFPNLYSLTPVDTRGPLGYVNGPLSLQESYFLPVTVGNRNRDLDLRIVRRQVGPLYRTAMTDPERVKDTDWTVERFGGRFRYIHHRL